MPLGVGLYSGESILVDMQRAHEWKTPGAPGGTKAGIHSAVLHTVHVLTSSYPRLVYRKPFRKLHLKWVQSFPNND